MISLTTKCLRPSVILRYSRMYLLFSGKAKWWKPLPNFFLSGARLWKPSTEDYTCLLHQLGIVFNLFGLHSSFTVFAEATLPQK